ncbi:MULTISPECIES: hypothetical protein [Rhizobium/Agrobacterium group]|uniref:Uncharacterized protein n=2 Tax=Neorhizobium TaxID=1525371 RepID=A0ABV0M9I3_9HYPH|nr:MULTISPECIES: hypothetical protein [Rhizobium/Agrobacterium group]KGD85888.1 hypothetical protein JL39_27275 [Rhizobium sp. YS-1r]MCC2608950.1 hypothetical protein [Neorhizobium petrolearium]WGI69192.1 hypothetical protein QEO92_03640 [Neorhizobium petrolearium]
MKTRSALAAILISVGAPAVHASSDDAWSEFRTEVDKACVSAAKGLIEKGEALVDPFGSESYGLAVVSGKAVGAKVTISAICVFDKKTKKAEIGGEISGDRLMVKTGK